MKCPVCGRKLDKLKLHVVYETEVMKGLLSKNGPEEENVVLKKGEKDRYYLCPYCDALITGSDEIARKIVRGEEFDC